MNHLPPTFPNGYVQLGTLCLALVSTFFSQSQLLSLRLPRKSLWLFPEINMKMLSLGVTGLMCARRQTTPQSYACRTPSRVFIFHALLDFALDPHHRVCILSFLMSFQVHYLALGFHQQHAGAVDVPLYPDPGVLGADATSDSLHTIDNMAHLLTSIESLSKPALVTLAKDHNILGPYNLSSDSLRDIISTHLTTGACALSSSEVCIKLARTFHSGAHSEESELYNQDITVLTLRIYALSKIAYTIKLRHYIPSKTETFHHG
jgi:hypothetical protein